MTRIFIMVLLVAFGSQGCCCPRSEKRRDSAQTPALRHYVGILIALPVGVSGKRGLWFHAKSSITSRDWTEQMSAAGLSRAADGLWTGPYPMKRDSPEDISEDWNGGLVVGFPIHARKGDDFDPSPDGSGEFVLEVDGDARTISSGPGRMVGLPGEDFVLRVRLRGDPEVGVALDVTYEHSKDDVVYHRQGVRDLRVNRESPLFVVMEARQVAHGSATK